MSSLATILFCYLAFLLIILTTFAAVGISDWIRNRSRAHQTQAHERDARLWATSWATTNTANDDIARHMFDQHLELASLPERAQKDRSPR